ncbi:hypothetical protein [Parageobacillus sp. G301]|uniref:hypothetical protein n=1 Tax=Parageobacillus sp. G301 TaxID=2998290 RepID=UPI00255686F9|nr:hypothetical protein [Parageobacillus sp. G301]
MRAIWIGGILSKSWRYSVLWESGEIRVQSVIFLAANFRTPIMLFARFRMCIAERESSLSASL